MLSMAPAMSSLLHVARTFIGALEWCNAQEDSEVGFSVQAQVIPEHEDEPHFILVFHSENMYMVRKEPITDDWVVEEIKRVRRN